jgi:hypothetical protein
VEIDICHAQIFEVGFPQQDEKAAHGERRGHELSMIVRDNTATGIRALLRNRDTDTGNSGPTCIRDSSVQLATIDLSVCGTGACCKD